MTQSTPPPARVRRPIVRPDFDPMTQPWEVANAGLSPVPADLLTPAALRSHVQAPPSWDSDEVLETRVSYPGYEGDPVRAAVLIPMMLHPEGVRVMFTQRAAHLHDHAGQISFPGGRIEASDADPVAAALREAQEETGLPTGHIEVLGSMPEYITSTAFAVTPVVALVRPGFAWTPDTFEVAEIFEVPLAFLMNPAHHRLHRAQLPEGGERFYYSMPWERYFIWGATAGMLRNLYHLLRAR